MSFGGIQVIFLEISINYHRLELWVTKTQKNFVLKKLWSELFPLKNIVQLKTIFNQTIKYGNLVTNT